MNLLLLEGRVLDGVNEKPNSFTGDEGEEEGFSSLLCIGFLDELLLMLILLCWLIEGYQSIYE